MSRHEAPLRARAALALDEDTKLGICLLKSHREVVLPPWSLPERAKAAFLTQFP
jgi:hypothetical protein